MNKLFSYITMTAAVISAAACSDSNTVDNPTAVFCEVNAPSSTVTTLTFDSYSGFQMVDIYSNVQWNVSTDADWITLSNRSGDAMRDTDLHLKVSVTENTTGVSRSATVSLKGAQGVSSSLMVVQNAEEVDPSGWQTAIDACNAMKVGLNLYNTLEANGTWFDQDDVTAFETCWGQPVTTPEWFAAVRSYGFNAVRIPVTWFPHMDEDWQVKEPWMARVEEVVNYALDQGLYVLLNSHHDTGDHDNAWLCADWANIDQILVKYNSLWKQIAERFNKYDEHLIFESYNELLDENHQWNTPKSTDSYLATNALAQNFVNTVRSTGGNNEHRNLVVNTYSANGAQEVLDNFELPTDMYPKHLMVQVHNYSPAGFTNIWDDNQSPVAWSSSFESSLASELDILGAYAAAKHVPVVIGESGAAYVNGDEELGKYAEYLATYSRSLGNLCLFYWFDVIDRRTCEPSYPAVMQGLLKGNDF